MKISFHEFFLGIVFEINIDLTFFFIILKVVASPEDGYVRTESEINKDEKLDFEWVSYDGFMPHYRKTYIQKMKDLWQSDLHPNARIGKMHALKKILPTNFQTNYYTSYSISRIFSQLCCNILM